jgi:hypothetical protein
LGEKMPSNLIDWFKRFWILIVVIAILTGSLIVGYHLFTKQIEEIQAKSEQLVTYNQQMGELFIAFQERIISQNLISQRHDVFMVYAMDIIVKHYLNHPNKNYRQMSAPEIILFLDEIWKQYEVTNISPFIALAFAAIETDYYFGAVGKDGERSVFQFMDYTARNTFSELHLPWTGDWWKNPQLSVRLFYAYYHKLSINFTSENEEKTIRWTALAYNAGLYRNGMKYHFDVGDSIDSYLYLYPLKRGISDYNLKVYNKYIEYRDGFDLKTAPKN